MTPVSVDPSDETIEADRHDRPRTPTSISEGLSELATQDSSSDINALFDDFDDDGGSYHASSSTVSEQATDDKGSTEVPEPATHGVYRSHDLPPRDSPRKLIRSMSIESYNRSHLKPRKRLWGNLKMAIARRGLWWNDRPAVPELSNHGLVQRLSSDCRNHLSLSTEIADMVLDMVPYFERQAETEEKIGPGALYKTSICIDEERGLKLNLEDLLNLVPGQNDRWLTDNLMETIVHIIAPADRSTGRGRGIWFCTDGMIQHWCAVIDPQEHNTVPKLEELISEKEPEFGLPARDIPPDASGMVFFTNRSDNHWKTVFAYVWGNTGCIAIMNSMGDSHQDGNHSIGHRGSDYDSLHRLMYCIAKDCPNERFRNADWLTPQIDNFDCPQQHGLDDCGIFAVNAAVSLLWDRKVEPGWNSSTEQRIWHVSYNMADYLPDFIRRVSLDVSVDFLLLQPLFSDEIVQWFLCEMKIDVDGLLG
ncbi:hypothetical protein FKW77_000087 [Venturia effusa]|uniref:Ubiquitin-like protease family profile domain-containing protein n=1 Tax=Venturia effusa TaxID=50376 RepID=A0A517KYU3_9PEZI|nr:hypothetical protein FKW77_000087 [Venturia effusa]